MTDIADGGHQPRAAEISAYIGNPLFGELCRYMQDGYQPLCRIEYSGAGHIPLAVFTVLHF